MAPVSDGELVRRCRLGDRCAFRERVQRHRAMVLRVARAITGSREDGEDVAQEAFVSAYRALGRYDSSRDFDTWLRAITVRHAVSALRARRRRRPNGAAEVAESGLGGGDEPAAAIEGAELRQRVRRAIGSLPIRQRVAITLFGLDGADLAETARAMGCSVGAVKTHLHRARERLARLLGDYVEGDG
ncbi:MAG TPA: RNA polymerase sigma factor [Armatimonadota bacterium]|nr:RNA polymerase sigma factor [Armatimonadota bacterium]HQK95079.1 RNA polymerase sigma factor [Armatimonadota bacterium]